jgi:hypothetical protein
MELASDLYNIGWCIEIEQFMLAQQFDDWILCKGFRNYAMRDHLDHLTVTFCASAANTPRILGGSKVACTAALQRSRPDEGQLSIPSSS